MSEALHPMSPKARHGAPIHFGLVRPGPPAAKEPILYRAEAPFRVVDVLIADIADDVARRVVSYKPAGEMVLRVVGLGCHDERILH